MAQTFNKYKHKTHTKKGKKCFEIPPEKVKSFYDSTITKIWNSISFFQPIVIRLGNANITKQNKTKHKI